jgi:hypothetical protein
VCSQWSDIYIFQPHHSLFLSLLLASTWCNWKSDKHLIKWKTITMNWDNYLIWENRWINTLKSPDLPLSHASRENVKNWNSSKNNIFNVFWLKVEARFVVVVGWVQLNLYRAANRCDRGKVCRFRHTFFWRKYKHN